MDTKDYLQLNRDLGFSLDYYVVTHLESPLLELVTDKGEAASLVFLTDDPDFNAWSLQTAARNRATDDVPDRPVAIYYVPVSPSEVKNIDWTRARAIGRFVLKLEKTMSDPVAAEL